MAARSFGLVVLVVAYGCQLLPEIATSPGTTGVNPAARGAAGGPGDAASGPATTPGAEASDPLRDPRERRLSHVRQLTRSRSVAMPRFSPDGRWIYVAEKRAKEIALLRVSAADPSKGIEEVAVSEPDAGAAFWGLVDGKGEPCAVSGSRSCVLEAWPDEKALVACDALWVRALGPEPPGAACPPSRGALLPCALASTGSEACSVAGGGGNSSAGTQRDEKAVRMLLRKPGASALVPLGAANGKSWMPAFSRNGARLVFVTDPSEGLSHLMVSFVDHADSQPEAIGPEAARTLDPTFAPNGDRVVFASTADDSAGQELDLQMVSVIGGALERVTFTPGIDRFPTFSPDGRSIAWISERDADAHAQDLMIAQWVGEP